MVDPDPLRDRIVDAAVAMAEEDAGGWHDLRLHAVARRLGVPLSAVLDRFSDAVSAGVNLTRSPVGI